MNYLDLTIEEIHEALITNKVTPLELVKESLKRAKNDNNNAFEYICEKEALALVQKLDPQKRNNLLWGIPFVIKDNFSTKDILTTASSNILKDYYPIYSSDTYQRLIDEGAIIIGKTALDELAMGGTGTTGHLGKTFNPWDKSHLRQVGGSSCGSASLTSSGVVPLGIGSDTGDSIRKPASYAGLVGFKPTWGRISRHGLFPFAPSLDHVGFFTRSVKDSAIALKALAGHDDKDMTSSSLPVEDYYQNINSNIKGIKIAIIDEIYNAIKDKEILSAFDKTVEELKKRGAIINHVSIDINLLRAIYPTYIAISCAEATSNNANLDGIKFGSKGKGNSYQEIVKNARTAGFSTPIKSKFLIGGFVLKEDNIDDFYLKAKKARSLMTRAINGILINNDIIFLPASPTVAPLFDNKIDRMSDEFLIGENHLTINNFTGLPSLTLPIGFKDNLPFGGNVTGRAYKEQDVLNVSLAIEEITGLKNIMPEN